MNQETDSELQRTRGWSLAGRWVGRWVTQVVGMKEGTGDEVTMEVLNHYLVRLK